MVFAASVSLLTYMQGQKGAQAGSGKKGGHSGASKSFGGLQKAAKGGVRKQQPPAKGAKSAQGKKNAPAAKQVAG